MALAYESNSQLREEVAFTTIREGGTEGEFFINQKNLKL